MKPESQIKFGVQFIEENGEAPHPKSQNKADYRGWCSRTTLRTQAAHERPGHRP
jgi:hypothetical protein